MGMLEYRPDLDSLASRRSIAIETSTAPGREGRARSGLSMNHRFHILLVEDSPTDAKIIERALRDCSIDARLTVLREGEQVVEYFRGNLGTTPHPAANGTSPDLVLLDLNLPGMDGLEVLSTLKGHPDWRVCPVIVLSTSRRDEDVARTYREGANSYFQKPGEYAGYTDLMQLLHRYWCKTALRPRLR